LSRKETITEETMTNEELITELEKRKAELRETLETAKAMAAKGPTPPGLHDMLDSLDKMLNPEAFVGLDETGGRD
jgi:hypothetical protein